MVEAFGNRSGQDSLFELLFGPQVSTASSFIANDDIHAINAVAPDLVQLAKWDSGMMKYKQNIKLQKIVQFREKFPHTDLLISHSPLGSLLLHGGDLQHLSWLGLQWTLLNQRPALRNWLQQLFPLRNLETSKLDSNAPESICLLDLEVQDIIGGLTQLVEAPYINILQIFLSD